MRLLKALYNQVVLLTSPVGVKVSSFASSTDPQLRQCLRYSCMNRQSRNTCMECSFQLTNKGALGIGSLMMQRSRLLSTNGMHTKVYVPGEENKKRLVLAPQKSIKFPDLENDRRAKIENLPVRGLTNVAKAAQDHEGLQQCSMYADVGTNLHGALVGDGSDTDENSDIFDDIFDSDDASSSKNKQNEFKKCSLSDLVRQYKEAFSSVRREREAATGADDSESKEERPSSRKEYKSGDLDVGTRQRTLYRAERGDSFMEEEEDKGVRPHRSGEGRRSAAYSSIGMAQNQSYNYKAGMGRKQDSGRIFGGDRPSRERSNRDGYSDAEWKEGGKYFSAKAHGNERLRGKESKARGGYTDESRRSGSRAERGGGFEGKRRDEGRARW